MYSDFSQQRHLSSVPPLIISEIDEAHRLFNAGAIGEAEALCVHRLARVPADGKSMALLGLIRHQQGDNEAALRLLHAAVAAIADDSLYRCNLGVVLLAVGRYSEAEAALVQAVLLDPGFAEAHFNLGNILAMRGELSQAADHFREAARLLPTYYDAWVNLALVLEKTGRGEEAIQSFCQALAIEEDPAIRFQLANSLFNAGDRVQALDQYRRVASMCPRDAEVHFNMAITLQKLARYTEAELAYRQALVLTPYNSEVFFGLAIVIQSQGRFDEAIAFYGHCLDIKPDFILAHYNMGIALSETGRYAEAITRFMHALALDPENIKVINNLGLVYHAVGDFDAAIATYRQAIAIQQDFADAYSNLGNSYFDLGDYPEAFKAYQQAVICNPDFDRAYYNLGCYWQKQNQIDTALSMYRRAIALNQDMVEAHWNLSHCLLIQGDFLAGFKEYAWRWRRKETPVVFLPKPEWCGEWSPEASLLVYTEQGVGDIIQFIRFLPLIRQRVGKIILACETSLCGLLRSLSGVEIIDRQQVAASPELFDYQVPLLNLPAILEITLSDLPAVVPYLTPDSEGVKHYQELFDQVGGSRKVGIVWQGNPSHRNDRNRSCQYEDFSMLHETPGTVFFSLQKQGQQSVLTEGVIDLAPHLATFADTAAMIFHLDLVITVDTSVAHLAGAMGKPVWVLLPFVPDWRWMLYREDSPWYPTMRLFRQQRPGDWSGLFAEVRQALSEASHDDSRGCV